MNYQAPDFNFIALAGQQIGEGVKGYAKAKKVEQNIEIDDNDKWKAYEDVYTQSVDRYMKETGETDVVKASTFVAKYYQKPMKSETGSQMVTRLLSVEPLFEKALKEKKVELYHQDVQQGAPTGFNRTGPQAKVGVEQPQISTPQLAGRQLSGTSLPEMQERTLQEASAPGVTQGPAQTARERYEIAQRRGVSGEETVKGDIQRAEDIETGQDYMPGETRSEYYARMSREGKDVTKGAAGAIGGALPTEKDIMTNERLKATQEAKNKFQEANLALRNRIANIAQRKVTGDERLEIMKAKADNMTKLKRMEIQIKSIEAGLAKANKGLPYERIDQTMLQSNLDELQELNESLLVGWENDKLYDDLLKEKGGIGNKKDKGPDVTPGTWPKKNDPLGIR